MRPMDRRGFLASSLAASGAAFASPLSIAGLRGSGRFQLAVYPEKLGNPIAPDFTGLSYETSQLSDPSFFSRQNAPLAAFHRFWPVDQYCC